MHGGRHHSGNAETGGGEPGDGGRDTGKRQCGSHADCGDQTARAGHIALPEAVDEPVTEQPTDEMESGHGDEAEGRQRGRGTQALAQIQCGPRTSGVFDGRPRNRDHHQSGEHRIRRHADPAGTALPCTGGGMVVLVRPGQQRAVGDQHDGTEHGGGDGEVGPARYIQGDRCRTHQAAEDRTGRPERVKRVDDRAAVAALHPQPVRVLGHIGDRVGRAGNEQRTGQRGGRRSQAGREHEQRDADGADHRDPRRAEPPDQRCSRQAGDQRPSGERRDGYAIDGVGHRQVGLDLGVPRQQVGENRSVGEEQRRHGDPGPPVLRRGLVEPSGRHGRRRYAETMSMHTAPITEDLLGLFPPGARLDEDGTLMVGGCRLDDVAAQFGTPAIVVSEDALRQRARDYLAAFRRPLATLRCGVRVKVVPVHGRSASDGRRGSAPRRRRWRRDPDRAEGRRRSRLGWCCTATPRPTRNSTSPSSTASA